MRVVETVPTNLAPSAHINANTGSPSMHSMSNVQQPINPVPQNSMSSSQLPHPEMSLSNTSGMPTGHGTAPVSFQHPQTLQHPSPSTTPQMQQQRKLIQSPPLQPPPPLVQQTQQAQLSTQPPIAVQTDQRAQSPSATSSATTPIVTKMAQMQAQQDNEQFALAWLRATFEPVVTMATRIEQQDMYKMYLTASSKIGRIGVASQLHFPRCVRSVFGGTVGPNIPKGASQSDSPNMFYEGIRIRSKPLAVVYKGTILVSVVLDTNITSLIESLSVFFYSKAKWKWLRRNSKSRSLSTFFKKC